MIFCNCCYSRVDEFYAISVLQLVSDVLCFLLPMITYIFYAIFVLQLVSDVLCFLLPTITYIFYAISVLQEVSDLLQIL